VRIEVVHELEPSDAKLEVPWINPDNPKLRYVDLKTSPESVEALDECTKYPQMARLLRKINAPKSVFRSAKCDVWRANDLAEDERLDFTLPFKIGSYIDLIFDRPELNAELFPHIELGERIARLMREFRAQAAGEIAIRACLFHPEERWGYATTFFIHAYGATMADAEREWSRAIAAAGDALETAAQPFRRE
jgi:hypothetical protein